MRASNRKPWSPLTFAERQKALRELKKHLKVDSTVSMRPNTRQSLYLRRAKYVRLTDTGTLKITTNGRFAISGDIWRRKP